MPTDSPEPQHRVRRLHFSPIINVSIVGTFVILLGATLYYGRSFFLPVVLALLITLVFAPLVRWFTHRGIPAPVAAVVLVVAMGAAGIGAAAFLSAPFAQMVSDAPRIVTEVRERFAFLREPFALLNEAGKQVQSIADGASGTTEEQRVVIAQPGILAWAAGTAAGVGTTLGATLILAFFLLATGDDMRHKMLRLAPRLRDKKLSLRVLSQIENEVSRYLITITAINAGLGFCVGLAMYALGMPSPLLWGVAAGLLNFIPYLGGFLGMAATIAVASVTYPTFGQALLPPLAYLGLQFLEAYFVTPTILGRRLELHIVLIIVFLAFTTWMWGIVGAVIGVPILVALKVISDNVPGLAVFSALLGAENIPTSDDTESSPKEAQPAATQVATHE